MRILGVDPGSRLTGYGCIDLVGNRITVVAHGTLRLSNTSGRAVIPLEQRLLLIHEGLSEVILKHRPSVMVVEKVFFAKNAVSALKLGQARGAVILSGMIHNLSIAEYSPTEVKQALVGHGQAEKQQVARMVELLVGQQSFSTVDASDGLALAICHAHAAKNPAGVQRRGRRRLSLAEAVGLGDLES
jgi:crossover junction endodeoxyribonuclease RuvC